jgi:hypothetical protein
MAGSIVRCGIVLLVCLMITPDLADAQARRNGRNARGGQGQRGGRGQDAPDAPTSAPAAPANPLIVKLLEGYGWKAELDKVGVGPVPSSLSAKFSQWVKDHPGMIRGAVVAQFIAPEGGRRGARTAPLKFDARGILSDGAPYHLKVQVDGEGVTNADAPAAGSYTPGTYYVISGATDEHPIGMDTQRAPNQRERYGVALTLEYEQASITAYDPAKPLAAAKEATPAAKPDATPAADRPDVLVLVHPLHRDWIPALQEWGQPTQAGAFINAGSAPPKLRFEAGTAPANFKKWMYALVLDQLLDDDPTPLGPVSKLSYTLYYRAADNAKPTTLLQGTISGIVTRGTPNAFLRGLIGGSIGHDMKVALGERVYGNDAGTPLITGDQRRHERAHRVQIINQNGAQFAQFPLENKLPVPIGVSLTASELRQVPAGWTFDSRTASTDRVVLDPGEKMTLTVPLKRFDGVVPEAATAFAIISDSRLAPYEN